MITFLYVGIGKLFTVTPIWITTCILYFLFIGILFIIRDIKEKISYNISWSSQQGDWALITVVLIGQTIIQQNPNVDFILLKNTNAQLIWASISIALGLFDHFGIAEKFHLRLTNTFADTYHNIVIVAVMVFILGITLPVIYLAGNSVELCCSAFFASVWIGTLIFDIKTGRVDQPKWLLSKGIDVKKRNMRNEKIRDVRHAARI